VTLLRSAGVETAEGAEDPDESRPEGPPFTLEDVIDFHFLLRRDDWFARLMVEAEWPEPGWYPAGRCSSPSSYRSPP
jgi:hypothetical protein